MPRLGDFWTRHQDIVLDHIISDRAHEANRAGVDLRVRYGDGNFTDETSTLLFGDRIIAVAAPAFLARHKVKSVQDLSTLPLLSVEGVDWTWTTWARSSATWPRTTRNTPPSTATSPTPAWARSSGNC